MVGIRWSGGRGGCEEDVGWAVVDPWSIGPEKSVVGLRTSVCVNSASSGFFTSVVSSSVRVTRWRLRNCSKLLYEPPKVPMLISVGVLGLVAVERSVLWRDIFSIRSLNSNSFTSPFDSTWMPGVVGVGVGELLGLRSKIVTEMSTSNNNKTSVIYLDQKRTQCRSVTEWPTDYGQSENEIVFP